MAEQLQKRRRRRGYTRLSRQHQVTIPIDAIRAAGISPGDELRATSPSPGRIVLEVATDVDERRAALARLRGTMSYPPGYLEDLRNEWD